MSGEINNDYAAGRWTEATHPKQELRSAYMVRTLIEKLRSRRKVRAAILNDGARHNDDIEQIVRGTKPHQIGAEGSSFVRIRSALFPNA
jgi:hypothetical protein